MFCSLSDLLVEMNVRNKQVDAHKYGIMEQLEKYVFSKNLIL